MKRIILIIFSIFVVFEIQAQDTYYYYRGEQQKLQTLDIQRYILFNDIAV